MGSNAEKLGRPSWPGLTLGSPRAGPRPVPVKVGTLAHQNPILEARKRVYIGHESGLLSGGYPVTKARRRIIASPAEEGIARLQLRWIQPPLRRKVGPIQRLVVPSGVRPKVPEADRQDAPRPKRGGRPAKEFHAPRIAVDVMKHPKESDPIMRRVGRRCVPSDDLRPAPRNPACSKRQRSPFRLFPQWLTTLEASKLRHGPPISTPVPPEKIGKAPISAAHVEDRKRAIWQEGQMGNPARPAVLAGAIERRRMPLVERTVDVV